VVTVGESGGRFRHHYFRDSLYVEHRRLEGWSFDALGPGAVSSARAVPIKDGQDQVGNSLSGPWQLSETVESIAKLGRFLGLQGKRVDAQQLCLMQF
jgi:hypothetical protein